MTNTNTQTVFISQNQFLKNLDQFKGLKFCTTGRWQAELDKTIGAVPVTLAPGELYLSVQNKTVDATAQTVNLT